MSRLHFRITLRATLFLSFLFIITNSWIVSSQTQERSYPPFMFSLAPEKLPKTSTSQKEDVDIIITAQQHSPASLQDSRYWNASYPSYRWHQIMVEAGNRSKNRKNGGRMAILHLAIYDALAEVWKLKATTYQQAPFETHSGVEKREAPQAYSTYICEYSATAAAAHSIIGYYFPDQKEFLNAKLDAFKRARLQTGLQYPNDIARGLFIGEEIAKKYMTYAKTDRTDKLWTGSVPKDHSLWRGKPSKWDPMKAQWRPFTLNASHQFRPGPPPTDWTADMEELREFNKNNKHSAIAWKWRSEPVWDLLLERKILEYDLDPFQAAFASALFHTSRFDATITAWDGKYHYWGIRPFQYDPNFKPLLIDTPNFPGYPAGHTTVAGALATALSHLFPIDADYFYALARECSESRFEGGVHFRTDNEVGLEVGEKVGRHVIDNFFRN